MEITLEAWHVVMGLAIIISLGMFMWLESL
jgi:hypothetical protein